jgi:hypothetical protein
MEFKVIKTKEVERYTPEKLDDLMDWIDSLEDKYGKGNFRVERI